MLYFVFSVICSDSFKMMRFPSKLSPSPVHFAWGDSILGGYTKGGGQLYKIYNSSIWLGSVFADRALRQHC